MGIRKNLLKDVFDSNFQYFWGTKNQISDNSRCTYYIPNVFLYYGSYRAQIYYANRLGFAYYYYSPGNFYSFFWIILKLEWKVSSFRDDFDNELFLYLPSLVQRVSTLNSLNKMVLASNLTFVY